MTRHPVFSLSGPNRRRLLGNAGALAATLGLGSHVEQAPAPRLRSTRRSAGPWFWHV